MKSLICSLSFIFILSFSYGQFGITQNLGSANTLVNVPANGGLRGGLINRVFVDTVSANLSQLDFYDGAQIKTLSPINAIWWRDSTNAKWIQVLPAGGTVGTFAWQIGGNSFFPAASGNFIFGIGATTTTNYGIDFRTRNTTRFILDSTGILPYSETVKGMGIDSVSGKLSYWKDEYKTQTENYLTYNIPFAPTSFTDSTLVSQLDGATTSYYFNKGLWLNGTYTGSIQNSRLVGWNYGFLTNQNFSQKLVFKVGDSSTSLSIGIGVKAGQALATTVNQANYITATLGDSTVSTLTNIALSQSTTKSSGILINKGDIIELQVNQIADSVQFFYRNLTNNNSYNIVRKIDFETNTQYLSVLGYPTIYFAKGNVKLISYSVYNQDFDYVFLGNSITAGYRTPTVSGFVNQLRPYTDGTINNMSRSASVSTDWVYQVKNNFNFTNKTVFMSGVCGNDLLGGLSAATSKANYQAIVSALRAKGNRIVHIDNPFRVIFLGSGTWADLVALNNWLDTTYRGIDTIIHTQVQTEANYPAWYTDGAHFNATGNTAITNIILNKVQNLFPLQNPITSTTVDSNYYKPTVKDTSGREFKVSWNNFSSGGTVTSVTGTANQISVATGTTTPVISLVSGGTLPGAWALGTPASGTVTNLTGTASININGTVGATTPTTGAFTTVTASTSAGVGTTSPSGRFEVKATTSNSSATDFSFINSSGANLFKVRNDGYVTLGSGSTASSLDIIGTFKTSSTNTLSNLSGTGTRLVTADANGILSATDTIVTKNSVSTFTNKRWTARVGSTTSSTTPTINTDNYDIYKLTAQTADITSMTSNLSGTPVDGDILEIQITGTAARAITWGSSFVSSSVSIPTTTVLTNTLTVIFQYYTTSSYGNNKWLCVNYY